MKISQILTIFTLTVWLAACVSDQTRDSTEKLKQASVYNAELGLNYMKQGRYESASKKLKTAVQQDPENGNAQHYLAILYQTLGEREKAEKHFELAMEELPKDMFLMNNYGVFLCEGKKYTEAREYFDRVLADPLYKNKNQVYENIGLCAQSQGNIKLAEEYYKKTLRVAPQSAKSLLGMAQLSFDRQEFKESRNYLYQYLQVASQTPASLWLGILLAKQSGNKNRIASYSVLLKGKYPDSEETAKLKKMEAAGKI